MSCWQRFSMIRFWRCRTAAHLSCSTFSPMTISLAVSIKFYFKVTLRGLESFSAMEKKNIENSSEYDSLQLTRHSASLDLEVIAYASLIEEVCWQITMHLCSLLWTFKNILNKIPGSLMRSRNSRQQLIISQVGDTVAGLWCIDNLLHRLTEMLFRKRKSTDELLIYRMI